MVNAKAENVFAQVDGEGNWNVLFQEIVNHRYNDTEVKDNDAFIATHTVTECHIEMMKVVEVLVQ